MVRMRTYEGGGGLGGERLGGGGDGGAEGGGGLGGGRLGGGGDGGGKGGGGLGGGRLGGGGLDVQTVHLVTQLFATFHFIFRHVGLDLVHVQIDRPLLLLR